MAECCGKDHRTRYCPDCGRRLLADVSLSGLVAHCRAAARRTRAVAEGSLRRRDADQPGQVKRREAQEVHARRWDKWADELDAILRRCGAE